MKLGFTIYGSLETLSGGYLYDRKLVEYLRSQGDAVEIISLPWRNYTAHLTDNLWFRLPDVVARRAHFPTIATLAPDLLGKSCVCCSAGEHPVRKQSQTSRAGDCFATNARNDGNKRTR